MTKSSEEVAKAREKWRQILADQERSGLTQRAYCEKHGLSLATLGYRRKGISGSVTKPERGVGKMLEVTNRFGPRCGVVLEVGAAKLTLPAGVPAKWLGELLRELRCGA